MGTSVYISLSGQTISGKAFPIGKRNETKEGDKRKRSGLSRKKNERFAIRKQKEEDQEQAVNDFDMPEHPDWNLKKMKYPLKKRIFVKKRIKIKKR